MKIERAPDFAPTYNEPQPDWVPIDRAMFYFSGNTFSTSEEECADSLIAALKDVTDNSSLDFDDAFIPANTYTILRDGNRIELQTKEVSTEISPFKGHVSVVSKDFWRQDGWGFTITGTRRLKQMLAVSKEASVWNEEVPDEEMLEADKHKFVLQKLYHRWQTNFLTAIGSGAARIMARPSILSPFQVIAWDQWQFFGLEVETHRFADFQWRSTATAPSGEKLFSIYVAPGERIRQEGEPDEERKCLQWLLQLMQESPDRPPKPLGKLCEEAISRFAGLTKRGFERSYWLAKEQSQNTNWSRPGAPKKFPQKSPQNK